ncbi:MAG: MFS transporter [Anaerolineaceae bacterium]|nr:MAG: MFS transporter [Anaerolineaceae bacterium]
MDQETSTESLQRPATLRSLWKAIFWVSFPFGILSFVLPIYGKDLGASALEIGGFFSALSVIPVIVRPFLGRALDRWGRRPFLLIGLLSHAVAMIAFSFSSTVVMLTVARFVQGLGTAFLWLTAYTIVADKAKETGRGHDFGLIDEAANRGAIIGTILGFTAIMNLTSVEWKQIWFWLFSCYAVLSILGLWFGWRGVGETRPANGSLQVEGRPISGQLLALMSIVFITGASTAMVWPLLMVFLQDILQAEVWALATAYLPAALLSAYLPSHMGKIADRWGRKPPMIAGLVVGAIASALIPQLRSIIGLATLWAVETLGYIALLPAERAFVADIAGEDVRGTSYGLYTFAYFLGAVLGPLIGGWLYDTYGHGTPFYLNAFVLLLGGLLVAIVLRESKPIKTLVTGN